MKNIIGGLLLMASFSSVMASADDGWVSAAGNDDYEISIQKGSAEFTKNKGGELIIAAISRSINKRTTQITLNKKYVKLSDCVNGQGQIVTLNIQGEYEYENDFVFGLGSMASATAELLCAVFRNELQKMDKKGI